MNSFELSTINKKCNQQIINYVKKNDVSSDIKRNVKSNNPFIFIEKHGAFLQELCVSYSMVYGLDNLLKKCGDF